MSAQHTPTPWQLEHKLDRYGETTIVGNIDGEVTPDGAELTYTLVAEAYVTDGSLEERANAAFIVQACNAYANLVAALKAIANGEGYYGAQAREYKEIARAALARTEAS